MRYYLVALFLLLSFPVAIASEKTAPGDLEGALLQFEGTFVWDSARQEHVFSDRPGLAAQVEAQTVEKLAALVACIDDPRRARATLAGEAVSLGVLCYQALRLIAYVEKQDWPGHIGPLASPAERRAARQAWQAALAEGAYALH